MPHAHPGFDHNAPWPLREPSNRGTSRKPSSRNHADLYADGTGTTDAMGSHRRRGQRPGHHAVDPGSFDCHGPGSLKPARQEASRLLAGHPRWHRREIGIDTGQTGIGLQQEAHARVLEESVRPPVQWRARCGWAFGVFAKFFRAHDDGSQDLCRKCFPECAAAASTAKPAHRRPRMRNPLTVQAFRRAESQPPLPPRIRKCEIECDSDPLSLFRSLCRW